MASKILTYYGKPIIRKGKQIFYGHMNDRYILKLTILNAEKVKDIDVATKVRVEIQDNTSDLGNGKTYRKTERENLYSALDLGVFWLSEALEN